MKKPIYKRLQNIHGIISTADDIKTKQAQKLADKIDSDILKLMDMVKPSDDA